MISVLVTGRCNRRCPSCTFRQVTADPRDLPVEDFRRLGPLIGPVRRICVSGGEPLLHTDLLGVVQAIKESFTWSEDIFLATNGDHLAEHPDVIREFDSVRVPILDGRTFPGCPSNADARARARDVCASLSVPLHERGPGDEPTVHWDRPGLSPWRCQNFNATILWDGRVFPCCMPLGAGVEVKAGVDWRAKVRKLPLPCDRCNLSSAWDVEQARQGRAFG